MADRRVLTRRRLANFLPKEILEEVSFLCYSSSRKQNQNKNNFRCSGIWVGLSLAWLVLFATGVDQVFHSLQHDLRTHENADVNKGHHVISVNTISVLLPWAILPCHILPKPPPCPGGMRWCPACTSSGSLSPWCLRGLTAWGTSNSCLQGAKDFFSSNCCLNICVVYAGSPRFITFAWMCPPTLSSMNILDRSPFICSWLILIQHFEIRILKHGQMHNGPKALSL